MCKNNQIKNKFQILKGGEIFRYFKFKQLMNRKQRATGAEENSTKKVRPKRKKTRDHHQYLLKHKK